jgi:hypothetical protein
LYGGHKVYSLLIMFFRSTEQRARSDAFDQYVASTDQFINNPMVIAELGDHAASLKQINDGLFLPNKRGGYYLLPRQEKHTGNIPFVPLYQAEAYHALDLIDPLLRKYQYSWPSSEAFHSEKYNLDLPEELKLLYEEDTHEEADTPNIRGIREFTLAKVQARIDMTPARTEFLMTRPVLMARMKTIGAGAAACAAVLAHEESHIVDLLEDGPLFGTMTYAAATELRAYHVSDAISRASGMKVMNDETYAWVDTLRRTEIKDTSCPYTPHRELVRRMASIGII